MFDCIELGYILFLLMLKLFFNSSCSMNYSGVGSSSSCTSFMIYSYFQLTLSNASSLTISGRSLSQMLATYCFIFSAIEMMALMALNPKSNLTTEACYMRTLASYWTLQILLESSTAFLNPAAKSKISLMNTASGTTIDTDLNRFFRSIGSSVRPA